MYLSDTSTAPKLKSSMSNREYLDAISAPSSGKGKRKTAAKPADELIEISDESDEEEQPKASETVEEEEPKVSKRGGEVQIVDDKEGA
jgi:DNA-directed RNA polymerase-3 subunit RPC5